MTTRAAVAEYFRREKAAMNTPQGADHDALIAEVALEFRMSIRILNDAVKAETITRPN
ncbi:MAG: hypothetical protein EpisKO_06220 [Epibacterium sp.]|jgi:hypothetical protein|nr:hypothetical protein [Tritonibacter mobilis]